MACDVSTPVSMIATLRKLEYFKVVTEEEDDLVGVMF
jgi:hypothetical protein